jgi:hypothetical protein
MLMQGVAFAGGVGAGRVFGALRGMMFSFGYT